MMYPVATMDWLYPLSGFVVGAVVRLTGMGDGPLMTPLLILLFGVHPLTAVGTDLLYAAVTKAAGAMIHSKKGNVDWRVAGWIGPRHGTHHLGPVAGAEAESDHSHYHIRVNGGGIDHRGRGDLLPPSYPRLRLVPR
jgi:Sulfite exporter TauE/SafE